MKMIQKVIKLFFIIMLNFLSRIINFMLINVKMLYICRINRTSECLK